ncbi:MAG: methyltransferase [Methylococcaceae bacterium]|nr:MAG: methyltransferase [Methylococcaceae bacterium]
MVADDSLMPRSDVRFLWDIMSGLMGYPALVVAHELNLFPLLHNNPLSLRQIAQALNIAERPAEAVVLTNLALGMLRKTEADAYALTALAEDYLLKDSPTYFGGVLDQIVENDFITSVNSLKQAVLTNKPQTYGGDDVFQSHEQQIERAKAFTKVMHSISMAPALVWPSHIELSHHRCLLDIGGGSGAHAIGALRRWPQLEAIVLDIEPVCEVAEDFIAQYGLGGRMKTSRGNLWELPYPFADVHFYSQIFHDWSEEKCRFLAQKSYDSLPAGGLIIIHEVLYFDDKTGPFMAAAASVSMLLWTEGRQYSGQELTAVLKGAGFVDIVVSPTSGYWSIVSGRKP